MGIDTVVQYLNLTLEVFFVNLLLSGDNAVVIALACRSLPDGQRRQAMAWGTGAAIALRVVLTFIASAVLQIPMLKLLGGLALVVIAIRLTFDDPDHLPDSDRGTSVSSADLSSVIGTVIVADLVMSTDNVVALAAVANGSIVILALGLLLSVPLLIYGSWHVTALLRRYPALARIGGAMLGWFAGDIAVSDPLYASWVDQQSPALRVVVPALVAIYVLLQSRIIDQSAPSAAAHRPRARNKTELPSQATPALKRTQGRQAELVVPTSAPLSVTQSPVVDGDTGITALGEAGLSKASEPQAHANKSQALGPVATQARPARRAPLSWRWLAIAGASLVTIAGAVSVVNVLRTSGPGNLTRYDCPSKDIAVYYRPGGRAIRIANAVTSVNGVVDTDNQIDWGDYHSASSILGFVPPTRVLFGSPQSMRIDGGMFEDMTCDAR
jgi:YjbE family integral membrane protein